MHRYSYREAWEHLHAKGITGHKSNFNDGGEDSRAALLSLVGAVVRHSSQDNKRILLLGLRKFGDGQESEPGSRPRPSELRQYANAQRSPQMAQPASQTTVTPPLIARSTVLLKEHGDQVGQSPQYSSQTVTLEPPLFKGIVCFNGLTFEGSGRTKREAKHQASKEACDYLGLKV